MPPTADISAALREAIHSMEKEWLPIIELVHATNSALYALQTDTELYLSIVVSNFQNGYQTACIGYGADTAESFIRITRMDSDVFRLLTAEPHSSFETIESDVIHRSYDEVSEDTVRHIDAFLKSALDDEDYAEFKQDISETRKEIKRELGEYIKGKTPTNVICSITL